jgi:hypothetical protein
MATVKMFGQQFAVDLVQKLGLDSKGQQLWKAVSRAHTGRTVPGTTITVNQSEILQADQDELNGSVASRCAPPSSSEVTASQAALEVAMAEERKTLPTPAELIAQHRANLPAQQVVSVSSDPTRPPVWGQHKSREQRA